jgi:uncharacterized hydrophobic protein (TIGR00271 family)
MLGLTCPAREEVPVASEFSTAEVQFSRELSTGRAVSRSLAILTAAFLFALHGSVMAAAGPAAVVSYLLAMLVISLNLLCYVELLQHSDREGGAYLLLRESTRGPVAFLTGWAILLGGPLLSAVLALGFAASLNAMVESVWAVSVPEVPVAAALVAVVAAYNVTGGRSQRSARDVVTWLAVAVVSVVCLACLPQAVAQDHGSFSPYGYRGVQGGLLLLLIGFLAFESVPLPASEIRKPRRVVPRAFLATAVLGTLLGVLASLLAGGLASSALERVALPLASLARDCLGRYGLLGTLAISVVFIPLALNSALLISVRQAQEMDQDRLLPGFLRRRTPRFRTPYVLLGLVAFAAILFSLLGDLGLLARMGSLCALFAMSMVALGDAIFMRSEGQNRTSRFRLPVPPLVPALAVVVNLFLIPSLGVRPIMAVGVWLLAGLIFYLGYARAIYVEAQEGVVVFKSRREETETKYRILVPLGPAEEQSELIRLAVAMAGQEGGEVIPLRVVTIPAQVPLREGARMAEGVESVFTWSLSAEDTGEVLLTPITRVARSVSEGIVDTAREEDCDLMLLSWQGQTGTRGRVMGSVLDPVVENAPCDVVLVKDGSLSGMRSILLPTSGGPHAAIAARLALRLAEPSGATVTLLYVCREDATPEDRHHGREMIEKTVQGLETKDLVVSKVITAPGVVSGILKESQEYDLLMLGASDEALFDRVLFGTIPERIARKSPVPVMIAKERAPLPEFWLKRLWSAVYKVFPTLDAEERSAVYREIREGARPDIDFFVMITLSATIATLGLLLNSGAVIIGGMLVAPLMSPIIGVALAIALGNVRLLRDAAESTIKGVFLGLVVALFLASILPIGGTTEEIVIRTTPNLLDLVIALASGAAGAYAMSRKDVSAALPGVAIAAALVPPLGVAGIGLAGRQFSVASGGLLLFGTNLVGITLAGTVNFLLLGFRPVGEAKEREIRIRRGLVISIILLLVVSLPLGLISGRTIRAAQEKEVVSRVLTRELAKLEGVSLVQFDVNRQADTLGVIVTTYAREGAQEGVAELLASALEEDLGREVNLRLISIPVSETTVP